MQKYPSETRVILSLKSKGPLSLKELSEELGISKMAVLNHIQSLEAKGMIARHLVKSSVGRPHYAFVAKEASKHSIASSEDSMLEGLIDYMERTGNSKLALDFLKERYDNVRTTYGERLARVKPEKRVEALADFREEENYYPELKSTGNGTYELLEFNCPIYRISKRIGAACSLETQLFSSVLDMDVSSTHRQVDGGDVCRFLIRKKEE